MPWRKSLTKFCNFLIGITCFIVAFSLILEYGFHSGEFHFYLHRIQLFAAVFLILIYFIKLFLAPKPFTFLRNKRGYFALIIIFLTAAYLIDIYSPPKFIIDFLERFPEVSPLIFVIQLYLILFICLIFANINQWINQLKGTILRPIIFIPVIFALIILVGTLLLLLPRAVHSGQENISFIDALFTATSATCVTGLIVKGTGLYFSRLGQLIILALIQIGGLGIMTITTFFGLILGRQLGLREQAFLGEALGNSAWHHVGRLVIKILLFVFLIEGVGAVLLYFQFLPYFGAIFHNLYLSVFHAVSAFNNAGFSLFADSFMAFKSHLGINLIITSLIIIGGLGFPVIFDLFGWFGSKIKKEKRFLTLHSRTVLLATLILIIFGATLLFIFENSRMSGENISHKILVSYFQSVTARTAGFNTISIGWLAPPAALILIILMFIGASPGSTGGGIKTSAFATILVTIKSWLVGRPSVRLFKRSLAPIVIRQAFIIFFLAILLIGLSTLILSRTEKAGLLDIVFEETSAFGTVGLSRGLTSNLTEIGKLVIIITMFLGRVGPLTLAIYLAQRGIVEKYKYPEDKVIVG